MRLDGSRRRRGLATAIAILVLTIVMAIAFSMCDMTSQVLRLSSADTWGDRARMAAEGGACDAMAQVKANQAWNAGFTAKPLPVDTPTRYTVLVTNNIGGSAPVVASDGTMVPAGLVYLKSSGTAGGVTRSVDVMVQVTPGVNPFNYAVFAAQSGVMLNIPNGATINSYDSSTNPNPSSFGSGAALGDNGSINVSKNANVLGDAYYVGSFSPSPDPTGIDSHQLASPLVWPNVTFTAPAPQPPTYPLVPGGSYTNVSLANNATLTLAAGTYYLQSLTLNNGSHLNVTGPVVIYMSGTMTVNQNATVNVGGRPQNMQFYSSYVSQSSDKNPAIAFTNNGVFNATVYAPQAWIQLRNNGEFFGSIVGAWTSLSQNSIIHYDTSLSSLTGPFGSASNLTVLSWDQH